MAVVSKNKYLQSFLENLIASHETEINFSPIDIELDSLQVSNEDIDTLISFLTAPRKRLFNFKIKNNDTASNQLELIARRAVLDQTAQAILETTSSEVKINPLKENLNQTSPSVRAGIQIQKSFALPKKPIALKNEQTKNDEVLTTPDLVLQPINLPELAQLQIQLTALGINSIQDTALQQINEHAHAFTDGIVPSNLPRGFYLNKEKAALCYTSTPTRLPSALAPALDKPKSIDLPSIEQAELLLAKKIDKATITQLLDTKNSAGQKNALTGLLTTHKKEISSFLESLLPIQSEFILPLLVKQFVLGGETHTNLLTRLITACINKNLNIDFLKDPIAQDAFLNPRGIKNLQKLLHLPSEQKEWWNTLTQSHLTNKDHFFDFNVFFETYTQVFLPRIAEKNLTLPNPCPIQHNGHILVTLNRVIDVIDHAENPQEQCLTLNKLNWGPTGAHFAMTQAPQHLRFKQVAECMNLITDKDVSTDIDAIYSQIDNPDLQLQPWLYRYMGQHWKKEIRLTDIKAQVESIQKLNSWTPIQKNQLIFILTSTFTNQSALNAETWNTSLKNGIELIQSLSETDRSDILQALARSYRFIPNPSFAQIHALITECIALKTAFPSKDFKNELLTPLCSILEKDGFDLINTLKERIQKTDPTPTENKFTTTAISSYINLVHLNREKLNTDLIKILAKINEPELNQDSIDYLITSLEQLKSKTSPKYYNALLRTLSQLNISKSQTLSTALQLQILINDITELNKSIPAEHNTLEKEENWFKDLILDKNFLPGCVFGNGDISKLDDLIVDAMVDAIKKRSSVLEIDKLEAALKVHLQNKLVPDALKKQLNDNLMPLLGALDGLIKLLQSPTPKFEEVLEKLAFFEEKKPLLLDSVYSVTFLGDSKGEYLLSFILTGKRKEQDQMTGKLFDAALSKLHSILVDEINIYFNNEANKAAVKDLDAKTTLSWFKSFNDTHSLAFLFKEELVQKKVLPALKKTLLQLNTQDPLFENTILTAAADLSETERADISLKNYKNKIESIAKYLNLLIDIKDKAPQQFNTLYKQLQTGPLARLNYTQKQTLISNLLLVNADSLDLYLKLTIQVLNDNPDADEIAIDRAINGLITLFEIPDLEPNTQIMFFKMSMAHNIKNTSPFPLADLNEFKKCKLPEQIKSVIIKQTIQLLSHMTQADSPDLIKGMVQQTQTFLTQNPDQSTLCNTLLKRVSLENLSRDLNSYPNILHQLSLLNQNHREKLSTILTGLASSKKDDTINLPTLLEITKGLGRRSAEDVDRVLKLFATPPYPIAQTLNTALLAHGSENLQAYCLNFDTNPFTKTGESRPLAQQFATDRVKDALLSLQDLMNEVQLPHSLQLKFAQQLNYIETLGYTDPLTPNDFSGLKKLTSSSRQDLKERASTLLKELRSNTLSPEQIEIVQLELLAYLREIYFRATGLFPNTTQMLMLLVSQQSPETNLLMSIKTGEGKSLITPMLAVLQWAQGGTVDVCTANRTLLIRDYENNCEPFFRFLGIESALIHSNSAPQEYKLNGINCSTLEDMSLFRLAAKEAKLEAYIQNEAPIHIVLDECDDALLDQTTLYKLVAETAQAELDKDNHAQWVYPLAYQFINLPSFRNTNPDLGKVWDEEEDLEQFRQFINKQINDKFNGDADKQNFMLATTNTELKQWINASCKAATLIENKHFIVQTIKEKDELTNDTKKKLVCVPLAHSTPKTGCIFTNGLQQALQARLIAEKKELAHYFSIDSYPPVLASQSARGLMSFYQQTKGRLLGISGTPGDPIELEYLSTIYGTQAIGVAPYAGDKRKKHAPIFTFSKDETTHAIENAINGIKRPMTQPMMALNPNTPIQTIEEQEAFIIRTNKALEEWSKTQTQPISIICEDFDEAKTLGQRFEAFKKAGFNVQLVTGKETPEKLARIIKQAGRANTITIGTAMLARGIDINPGDHPEGLFVIQTYPDSKRMTTQIGGRAARNGKPGQWLPIYQVKKPNDWISIILYFIFPWYRQSKNLEAIEQLQTEINQQATIDRLYTQAIDQAQQTLMQQIQAWESLLIEIYPDDPKVRFELYQWREAILSELTHIQESGITESTLKSSIAQFKNSIGMLWESAKEEKWVSKAQKATHLTVEQSLKLNYLMHIDFSQELNIQTQLQHKNQSIKEGTKAVMHQNLDTIIQDKAGAVLEYSNPSEADKNELQIAQTRQILPNLIGELCALYPQAVKKFTSKANKVSSYFIPATILSLVEKVLEQKDRALLRHEDKIQITQQIIQFYQNELKNADNETIHALLNEMKPLIISHSESLNGSLIEQFKLQGLIIAFGKIYAHSGLPADDKLTELKTRYDNEIMKTLAEHLSNEFSWSNKSPQPLHAILERTVAREAALAIYDIAEEVKANPNDEKLIQELYRTLQEHRVNLQGKRLFSIQHTSPRAVINRALEAIESLSFVPHCNRSFQISCHDSVLATFHLNQFLSSLEELSEPFELMKDVTWGYLNQKLKQIANQDKKGQNHLIMELHEAVERFSAYPAFKTYKNQIKDLKKQLENSLETLTQSKGLKQNYQVGFFATKQHELAALFQVNEEHLHIQSGSDGIDSFIEVQIEDAPLQDGFTGYQSSATNVMENEKARIAKLKLDIETNKDGLLNLDSKAIDLLPPKNQMEFKKLLSFKALLTEDWRSNYDNFAAQELPKQVQIIVGQIKELSQINWKSDPVNLDRLREIMPDQIDANFLEILKKQSETQAKRIDLSDKLVVASHKKTEIQEKITSIQGEIDKNNTEIKDPKCGTITSIKLQGQSYLLTRDIATEQNHILELNKRINSMKVDDEAWIQQLVTLGELLDTERNNYITSLITTAKASLNDFLDATSKQYFDTLQKELNSTDSTFTAIENNESKKARYQTRRFFNPSDLLKFEARLAKEEELIPEVLKEEVKSVHEDLGSVEGLTI